MYPSCNHEFQPESERRMAFRLTLHSFQKIQVRLFVNDKTLAEGLAGDISLGGIAVLLDERILGSIRECTACFDLPTEETPYAFELRCGIAHVTEVGSRIVCGLEFLDILERVQDYKVLFDFLSNEIERRQAYVPQLIEPWPQIL